MSPPPLESAIYEGEVRHRRAGPIPHEFRFPLFMVYLDLAERGRVFSITRLWSASRPAPARFRRSDYLDGAGCNTTPLDTSVRDRVEHEINFVGFEACWFGLVLTTPDGHLWLAISAGAAWFFVHLFLSPQPAREGALILIGAAIGTAWDAASLTSGLIAHDHSHAFTLVFLARFLVLWILFGTTIRIFFAWFRDRLPIAAAVGALGGPAAYWFGIRMGMLSLPSGPFPALLVVALQYALLLPLWVCAFRRALRPRGGLPV